MSTMASTKSGSTNVEMTDSKVYEVTDKPKVNSLPKSQPEVANGLNGIFQNPVSDDDVEAVLEEEIDEWDESDDDEYEVKFTENPVAFGICSLQLGVRVFYRNAMEMTKGYFVFIIFCLLYAAYFIACMDYEFGDEGSIRLLVCTILGIVIASRRLWLSGLKKLYYKIVGPDGMSPEKERKFNILRLISRWVLYLALLAYMIYILVDELRDDLDRARGLPGLAIMIFLCLLMSARPHMINWHTIYWSIGLQFLFSVFTLRYTFGRDAIEYAQDRMAEFFANSENAFVTTFGPNYRNMGLAFNAIPLAFMASAALTVLYYIGAMQFIVSVLGKIFRFIFDTDYIESLSVAIGIFMDGPLAVLALRPYLNSQSKSQMFTIIISTISSMGGTILAIFTGIGIPLRHVLAAMLISAPATFTVSKLLYPERKRKVQKEEHSDAKIEDSMKYANILDAFQIGALVALPIVANIIAIIYSFLCGIEWISSTLEWFGDRIGEDDLTLDRTLSYIMYPVALGMGIQRSECLKSGRVIGIKLIVSNVIGFSEMQKLVQNRYLYYEYINSTINPFVQHVDDGILLGNETFLEKGYISERTEAILTYGLSGFSSFMSVCMTFATLYALAPKRRLWLAKMAPYATIGGNLANFMTGCFASIFYRG